MLDSMMVLCCVCLLLLFLLWLLFCLALLLLVLLSADLCNPWLMQGLLLERLPPFKGDILVRVLLCIELYWTDA